MLDFLWTIKEFLDRGGFVVWGILFVSLMMWTLIFERLWFMNLTFPKRVALWRKEWSDRCEHNSWSAHRIREAMISQAKGQLNTALSTLRTLIAICPLFGLLGTVTGMVEVFDVMAVTGTNDARALASGVSLATLPTMAGLMVSLTGYYFGSKLVRDAKRETQKFADSLIYN